MRFGRTQQVELGQPHRTYETPDERAVREARIATVRACFTELQETGLVERGPYLVDVDSDLLYTPYRGATFARGKATLDYVNPSSGLAFFVNRAGDVVLLEPVRRPATWSEVVERKARKQAAGPV